MHTYSQEYLPKLQAYQPELLQRLELLVNIDSGSGQVQGINQIMTHLEQWLSALGFAVTLYEAVPAVLQVNGEKRIVEIIVNDADMMAVINFNTTRVIQGGYPRMLYQKAGDSD